jgi:hypothetical protein
MIPTAFAWWSTDWKSYEACMEFHESPKTIKLWGSPEKICNRAQAARDEERRKKEETTRLIELSCQAESVTRAQYAACVELSTGHY